MAKLTFTKMHGAGNDFIVINAMQAQVDFSKELWQRLAHRQFGIGADQILLVDRAIRADVDFRYRIINADGNEVENCGNGARCFVRYVIDKKLTDKHTICVETVNGLITLDAQPDGCVTVDMGQPNFTTASVHFEEEHVATQACGDAIQYQLFAKNAQQEMLPLWFTLASMGNPHAMTVVDDVDDFAVNAIGAQIESHPKFLKRVNVAFMQVLDAQHVKLRVFERGSGETLACGTGACAAVVSGVRLGLLQGPVAVQTRGGVLTIDWQPGKSVKMTGPATHVYDGEIDIDQLLAAM